MVKYLAAVLIAVVLDVVSGLLDALAKCNISSQKMRLGLINKAKIMLMAISSALLAKYAASVLPILELLLPAVSTYIVTMELVSIGENLGFVEFLNKWISERKGK